MTASPPAAAEITIDHLSQAELEVVLQLRRVAVYGWGRLTVTVQGGTLHIAEYTETHKLSSA